jgi:hypothetical protein
MRTLFNPPNVLFIPLIKALFIPPIKALFIPPIKALFIPLIKALFILIIAIPNILFTAALPYKPIIQYLVLQLILVKFIGPPIVVELILITSIHLPSIVRLVDQLPYYLRIISNQVRLISSPNYTLDSTLAQAVRLIVPICFIPLRVTIPRPLALVCLIIWSLRSTTAVIFSKLALYYMIFRGFGCFRLI